MADHPPAPVRHRPTDELQPPSHCRIAEGLWADPRAGLPSGPTPDLMITSCAHSGRISTASMGAAGDLSRTSTESLRRLPLLSSSCKRKDAVIMPVRVGGEGAAPFSPVNQDETGPCHRWKGCCVGWGAEARLYARPELDDEGVEAACGQAEADDEHQRCGENRRETGESATEGSEPLDRDIIEASAQMNQKQADGG